MSTSDNFEKILTEIENEIDQIQIKFKNDENKADPAARKTSMSKYGPVHPITHTPEDVLVDQIDSQLGGFYGSMELRDALKEFKRMEIPDSDDFFNEALSTNSTSDIRRASKEPRNA
ncbi:unnamed protein product [Nippostrongylus brasiliensis]|uniref:Uncharacterized protein n=1 Tax=Nippostrongylus brasiliensis TaxID=27835 RepID=A0A0N4Y2S3_NIPBR|nr:unnamed protein product [Nippostrongylus brasiliensis]